MFNEITKRLLLQSLFDSCRNVFVFTIYLDSCISKVKLSLKIFDDTLITLC